MQQLRHRRVVRAITDLGMLSENCEPLLFKERTGDRRFDKGEVTDGPGIGRTGDYRNRINNRRMGVVRKDANYPHRLIRVRVGLVNYAEGSLGTRDQRQSSTHVFGWRQLVGDG